MRRTCVLTYITWRQSCGRRRYRYNTCKYVLPAMLSQQRVKKGSQGARHNKLQQRMMVCETKLQETLRDVDEFRQLKTATFSGCTKQARVQNNLNSGPLPVCHLPMTTAHVPVLMYIMHSCCQAHVTCITLCCKAYYWSMHTVLNHHWLLLQDVP